MQDLIQFEQINQPFYCTFPSKASIKVHYIPRMLDQLIAHMFSMLLTGARFKVS